MTNYNYYYLDGNVTYSNLSAGDTITFSLEFNFDDFSFLKNGDDLLIYPGNGATIRLENQLLSDPLVYSLIFPFSPTINLNVDSAVYATSSNETIYGTTTDDSIYGGSGNNNIYGSNGDDIIYGGDGDDFIAGNDGQDTIYGGSGNDTIQGGSGEIIYAGDGDDVLRGFGGEEVFDGGAGTDRVWWRDYQNTNGNGIIANLQNGTATDGDNNESDLINIEDLTGSVYADTLHGDNNANTIRGGADRFGLTDGDDDIYGYGGDDLLYGDSGADVLIGGQGADKLYGGASDGASDTFKFSSDEDSVDQIYQFEYGTDKINISDLLSGYIEGLSDIEDYVDIVHVGSRFDIYIDSNGNGGGSNFTNVAKVYTNISDTLTAQDLLDNGTLIAELSPL